MADQWRAADMAKQGRCMRSIEWGNVPLAHRMAVLLLAGIDGDLGQLSRKAWPEFAPLERESITVAMRSLHASLSTCNALRVKA